MFVKYIMTQDGRGKTRVCGGIGDRLLLGFAKLEKR